MSDKKPLTVNNERLRLYLRLFRQNGRIVMGDIAMKKSLEKAVHAEDYELAAEIRDEIEKRKQESR